MPIYTAAEDAAYYNRQPKKRAGAGILFFNQLGQLLILKPNYSEHWLYPGGGVEEAEAPLLAALRECREEIGIELTEVWPAYINYNDPRPSGLSDGLQFVFTTNPVADDFLDKLTLQKSEIDAARFVNISSLHNYFSADRNAAVQTYLKYRTASGTLYLENGRLVGTKLKP